MAIFKRKKNKIIESAGDRVLSVITTIFLILILIVIGYPIIYVVSCSFSSGKALETGRVLLWPVEPTLAGYKFVFQYPTVWIGYRNTIFYTILGVAITMFLQIICAYPLARTSYHMRGVMMKYFFITTMVGAGLIPTYIVKTALGLKDTVWAVLLAGCLGVHNVIILRTALKGVPNELYDAAAIDGAGEIQTMIQIALPLVKATTSVLILYSAVGCWNDYFNAMIYLNDKNLYPLQLFLRVILTAAQSIDKTQIQNPNLINMADKGTQQIQYALIVVATVPVLVFYFVIPKSFKKGVMIGSVKA